MAASGSIPIICCGKQERIGTLVIECLKPKVEVVQFILPGESGSTIIPALLAGKPAPAHPEISNIGSGNYSQPPRAVLFGGAFEEAIVRELRDAVRATEGARKTPWLCNDSSKTEFPVTDPRYIAHVSQRAMDVLLKLDKEGALDGSNDDIVMY